MTVSKDGIAEQLQPQWHKIAPPLTPWTVLTLGGGATLLLALALVLWFRTRENVEATTENLAQSPVASPRARRIGRS